MSLNLDNNPQLGQKAFVSTKIGMIDASGTDTAKKLLVPSRLCNYIVRNFNFKIFQLHGLRANKNY
jgi:hypothetical protein